jgi:hypothetical protein
VTCSLPSASETGDGVVSVASRNVCRLSIDKTATRRSPSRPLSTGSTDREDRGLSGAQRHETEEYDDYLDDMALEDAANGNTPGNRPPQQHRPPARATATHHFAHGAGNTANRRGVMGHHALGNRSPALSKTAPAATTVQRLGLSAAAAAPSVSLMSVSDEVEGSMLTSTLVEDGEYVNCVLVAPTDNAL